MIRSSQYFNCKMEYIYSNALLYFQGVFKFKMTSAFLLFVQQVTVFVQYQALTPVIIKDVHALDFFSTKRNSKIRTAL